MSDRLFRCRVLVDGKVRCGFEGFEDDADEHAAGTGHQRCCVDGAFLTNEETRVCGRCVSRTRDALTTIRDADLETVIENATERTGQVPANLLTMIAAGNASTLRPYKPVVGSREIDVPHGALVGQETCWLPYWEHRAPADGREHYADHRGWNDPLVPFAELNAVAEAWMAEEERSEIPPMSVKDCCDFLLRRMWFACRASDTFDDEARTLWQLAAQVANTAGLVNHPEIAPARCFDCGGPLVAPYREPDPIIDTREGRGHEGRAYVYPEPNDDDLDPVPLPLWECADCERIYQPAEYWLALRAFLEDQAEKAG
jgi:hypothetical protein